MDVLNIVLLEIQYKRLKLQTKLQDLINKGSNDAKLVSKILGKLALLDLKQQQITIIINQNQKNDNRDSK